MRASPTRRNTVVDVISLTDAHFEYFWVCVSYNLKGESDFGTLLDGSLLYVVPVSTQRLGFDGFSPEVTLRVYECSSILPAHAFYSYNVLKLNYDTPSCHFKNGGFRKQAFRLIYCRRVGWETLVHFCAHQLNDFLIKSICSFYAVVTERL